MKNKRAKGIKSRKGDGIGNNWKRDEKRVPQTRVEIITFINGFTSGKYNIWYKMKLLNKK